jgi:glutaredoxin
MSTYIIYTKTNCPSCDRAKYLLKKENLKTIYINCDEMLKRDRQAFLTEMRKKTKFQDIYFPMIFQDDYYIGNYDELLEHLIEFDEEF